jgi:capsular polysaccharide biosynthesis protein
MYQSHRRSLIQQGEFHSNSERGEGSQLSEQAFDVRGAVGQLRQHSWTIAGFALIGALVGAGVLLWLPKTYSATALVLVPTNSSSASASNSSGSPSPNTNVTDSEIANSSAVLGKAAAKSVPRLTIAEAKRSVTAQPIASNIVQITATGSSSRQTQLLANSVASGLVAFVSSTGDSAGTSAMSGLEAQAAQLTKQVNSYDQEIQAAQAAIAADGQSSSASQQETALLGTLTSAQSDAALRLQNINSEITAAKLETASANGGTAVIQSAIINPTSTLSRLLPILAGGFLGFLVGCTFVTARRRRRRLTTREEIANAVGAPVVFSPRVRPGKNAATWLSLLREYTPEATELWNVNRALSQLDLPADGWPVITVVTLSNDKPAIAGMVHFAVSSTVLGLPTSLILTSDDTASSGISGACDILSARDEVPRANLRILKGSPTLDDSESELTVISVVLDADRPKLPAFVARGTIVLAISAAEFRQEQLTRVLLALGHEGLSVKGLIVTNPLNSDRTSGALPRSSNQVDRFLRQRALGPVAEQWVGPGELR